MEQKKAINKNSYKIKWKNNNKRRKSKKEKQQKKKVPIINPCVKVLIRVVSKLCSNFTLSILFLLKSKLNSGSSFFVFSILKLFDYCPREENFIKKYTKCKWMKYFCFELIDIYLDNNNRYNNIYYIYLFLCCNKFLTI